MSEQIIKNPPDAAESLIDELGAIGAAEYSMDVVRHIRGLAKVRHERMQAQAEEAAKVMRTILDITVEPGAECAESGFGR